MSEENQTEDTGLLDDEGNPITVENAIAKDNGEDTQTTDDSQEDERPEWLPEKFKTAEDLAKSYSELEKTLREKGKLPPETYEFEDTYNLPEEEVKQYSEFAKETGLTNAQAQSVMNYAKEVGYFDVPDYDTEMQKLGDESESIMNSLESYANQKLLPNEREALNGMVYTAEQAKLLHKIIKANNNIPAKPGESEAKTSKQSLEKELRTLLSQEDIRSNRDKQEEAKMLAQKIASM